MKTIAIVFLPVLSVQQLYFWAIPKVFNFSPYHAVHLCMAINIKHTTTSLKYFPFPPSSVVCVPAEPFCFVLLLIQNQQWKPFPSPKYFHSSAVPLCIAINIKYATPSLIKLFPPFQCCPFRSCAAEPSWPAPPCTASSSCPCPSP